MRISVENNEAPDINIRQIVGNIFNSIIRMLRIRSMNNFTIDLNNILPTLLSLNSEPIVADPADLAIQLACRGSYASLTLTLTLTQT